MNISDEYIIMQAVMDLIVAMDSVTWVLENQPAFVTMAITLTQLYELTNV